MAEFVDFERAMLQQMADSHGKPYESHLDDFVRVEVRRRILVGQWADAVLIATLASEDARQAVIARMKNRPPRD